MENLTLGYALSFIVGISLGTLGGGGSILTVPILVYVLKLDPKLSIALSLGIVGISGIFGLFNHLRLKNVLLKTSLLFGIFAMIGTSLGTKIAFYLSSKTQLIIFAATMLMASILMINKKETKASDSDHSKNKILFVITSLGVGVMTGVIGVGGGFLIVPSLVILSGVPTKKAIGSSLAIISVNSLVGFYQYQSVLDIPYSFMITFSLISIVGILTGSQFAKKISAAKLNKAFGYFLAIVGSFVLIKNSL